MYQVARKEVKKRFVESSAILILATPITVALETLAAGMTDEVSLKSRVGSVINIYGLIPIAMKGRELTRKAAGITDQSSRKVRDLHDACYGLAYSAIIRPAIYLASGERDLEKILWGTLLTSAASFVIAPAALGYVDVFKDLVGEEPSERTPKWLRNRSPAAKKCITGGLITTSAAATSLVYILTQN